MEPTHLSEAVRKRYPLLRAQAAVVARWDKTGILHNLEPYAACHIAVLLENQRLFQESALQSKNNTRYPDHTYEFFKRAGIPAVRRIYDPRYFIGFDLVSFQTLLGPAGMLYSTPVAQPVGSAPSIEDWCARSRKLKTCLTYDPRTRKKRDLFEYDAEVVGKMASDVTQDINREILTDLRNNAGTICNTTYKDRDSLVTDVIRTADAVRNKIFRHPNWLVTSQEISSVLRQEDFQEADSISRFNDASPVVMRLGRLTLRGVTFDLYEDRLFQKYNILLGYKDPVDPYHAGYFYGGYVPLAATAPVASPDFIPRAGIMTRFAKKLVNQGAKFYARIKVDGIPLGE